MPYDPTTPINGTTVDANVLRGKFNFINDKVDALPVPVPETDPVFAASEAALLEPGDKAKIDAALQPGADILQLIPPPGTSTFKFLVTDSGLGDTLEFVGPESLDATDIAYSAGNPGHWAGSPPATPGEAIDRLAALASNNGANPIP